jgi:hypothetical protein
VLSYRRAVLFLGKVGTAVASEKAKNLPFIENFEKQRLI